MRGTGPACMTAMDSYVEYSSLGLWRHPPKGGFRLPLWRVRESHSKGGAAMAIRVLIVDDHSVVREGLRMFLARDPDLEVVGEAADGAEALQQARLLRPDVVIMDVLMPVLDGIAATRMIRSELPETEILASPASSRAPRWSRRFGRGPLATCSRI